MTNFVYRVACKDNVNRGMYTSKIGCYMQDMGGVHPSPSDDARFAKAADELNIEKFEFGRYKLECRRFGFKSLDQLRAWIYNPEWRRKLEDEDFCVYEIVPKDDSLIVGDSQCAFHIDQVNRKISWEEVSK